MHFDGRKFLGVSTICLIQDVFLNDEPISKVVALNTRGRYVYIWAGGLDEDTGLPKFERLDGKVEYKLRSLKEICTLYLEFAINSMYINYIRLRKFIDTGLRSLDSKILDFVNIMERYTHD